MRSPPPSPTKTAPPSQTPSVTGDTGGEIAVPLVDSVGSGRTAVPSVGSGGISMAPVTGGEIAVPLVDSVSGRTAVPSVGSGGISMAPVTGGESAVPLVDSIGGRAAVPSVDSIGISSAPVTGDIDISDFDGILNSKDEAISVLERKVRANNEILDKFKERIRENREDLDRKNKMIINLDSKVWNLNFEIAKKDRHIGWLSRKFSRLEEDLELAVGKLEEDLKLAVGKLVEKVVEKEVERDIEIGLMMEMIEAKNLILEEFEKKIEHLEYQYASSTDEIVRQFNDLLMIGELRLKEKAKLDDAKASLFNENRDLKDYLHDMRRKMLRLQDREIILKEEQWRIKFEHDIIMTCYAGAYKELKTWFKERCKEMEEFFKRQYDIIDS